MESRKARVITALVSLGALAALIVLFLSWSQEKVASGPRIAIAIAILIAFFAAFFFIFSWVSKAEKRK